METQRTHTPRHQKNGQDKFSTPPLRSVHTSITCYPTQFVFWFRPRNGGKWDFRGSSVVISRLHVFSQVISPLIRIPGHLRVQPCSTFGLVVAALYPPQNLILIVKTPAFSPKPQTTRCRKRAFRKCVIRKGIIVRTTASANEVTYNLYLLSPMVFSVSKG